MPPLTRSTRDPDTASEMGERYHPNPELFNNETTSSVDVDTIVRTVTTQLGHTLDE